MDNYHMVEYYDNNTEVKIREKKVKVLGYFLLCFVLLGIYAGIFTHYGNSGIGIGFMLAALLMGHLLTMTQQNKNELKELEKKQKTELNYRLLEISLGELVYIFDRTGLIDRHFDPINLEGHEPFEELVRTVGEYSSMKLFLGYYQKEDLKTSFHVITSALRFENSEESPHQILSAVEDIKQVLDLETPSHFLFAELLDKAVTEYPSPKSTQLFKTLSQSLMSGAYPF